MAVGKNLPFVEYKISANKRQALKTTRKTHLVQRPNLSSMSFLCMQTNGFKVCTNRYILLQLNLCIYRHMKQSLLQVFFLKRCQHNANNMRSFGRTVKKKVRWIANNNTQNLFSGCGHVRPKLRIVFTLYWQQFPKARIHLPV